MIEKKAGKTVKQIIDGLNGDNDSDAKELMETLYLLAEQKAEVFLMQIKESINKNDDKKLPITVLIDEEKVISAYVNKDIKNLEDIVSDVLDLFLKHDKETVVKKVKDALVIALQSFLGTSIAKSDSMEKYYVIINEFSAIRLDIKSWFYSVESTSLHNDCEKIVSTVVTKSVVDLSKIDISTFIYFYQTQLINSGVKGEELEQELENVRRIYNKFQQSMND